MKKRGAKIKHGRVAPPTMVAMHNAPEVSTQERIAVLALTSDWGTTSHFNTLLDCQHMLMFGANEKGDDEAMELAKFADIAMKSIRARWIETGKLGATGEEIKALRLMVDYSESFWKRTSGLAFVDASGSLDKLRKQQRESA